MDINGPCIQGRLNKIAVNKKKTVLSMLARLQAEQLFLTKHAHAPTRQLTDALNRAGKGDGDFMNDAYRRQIFNWLPVVPQFKY